MQKDYNTGVPIKRAMFCRLYKTIIIQFFKGVFNFPTVAMAQYSTVLQKDPLKLSFSKIT